MNEEQPSDVAVLNPGDSWQALGQHVAEHPEQYHEGIKPIIEGLVQQHTGVPPTTQEAVQALRMVPLEKAAGEAVQAVERTSGVRNSDRERDEVSVNRVGLMAELSKMAPQLASEAFDVASKIPNKYDKYKAAARLVRVAVETNNIERCLDLFADEESNYSRNNLLGRIATELSHSGKPDEAITQARRISSVDSRMEALTKILEDHPEKASEIHTAVLDTSIDSEAEREKNPASESDFERDRYRVKALIKLADHLPEAAKEAAERVRRNEGELRHYDIDDLLELSKREPSITPKVAELYDSWQSQPEAKLSLYELKNTIPERADKVRETALALSSQGHSSEAVTLAETLGSRRMEDIASELANAAIRFGHPKQAAELAKKLGGYEGVKLCKNILPNLQDPETRSLVIDQIRRNGNRKDLAAAAKYAPELILEVEAQIEGMSSGFDKRDAQDELIPAFIASGRKEEALKLLSNKMSWQVEKVMESLELPANLEVVKDIAYNYLKAGDKARALAKLAKFYPEAASDCMRVIDEDLVPEIAEYRAKERHERLFNELDTVETVKLLAEAGFVDEAAKVSEILIYRDNYIVAVSDFVHSRPDMLPTFIKYIGKNAGRMDENERLQKLATVIGRLPEDQIAGLLPNLSEMESSASRLMVADIIGGKLISSGRSQDLLNLLPEKLSDRTGTELYKKIAVEFAKRGELNNIRSIVERFSNQYISRVSLLADIVDVAPELAPDLWRDLQEKLNEPQYRFDPDKFVIKIAASVPEAADYLMDSLRAKGTDYSKKISAVNALIDAGRASEALEIVGSMWGIDEMLPRIIPTLIEHGDIALALDKARSISDPFVQARALASLVPREHEPAHKALLHELLGGVGVEGSEHAISDRSLNARFFTEEIAKEPLLIETFLGRATSPAELLAIMKTIDAAAEMVENGNDLRYQALKSLKRFDTKDTLAGYWKADLQEQALGGEKADHNRFKNLPNLRQLDANLKGRTSELVHGLLKSGYGAADLFEHPWLLKQEILEKADKGNIFPINGSKVEQHEWLADNSFVGLQGFSRRQIGQILANRLGNNMEYSLHDASQWLETFQVGAVMELYNSETGQIEDKRTVDPELEDQLLGMLLDRTYSPEELRRLPGFASASGAAAELKTQKFDQLFHEPSYAIVYAAILQELAASETGRIDNRESLEKRINGWAESGIIDAWLGQSKEIVNRDETLASMSLGLITNLYANGNSSYDQEQTKISNIIGQLNSIGKSRKEYIDSTTTWLKTYQNLPAQKLQRAWGERAKALAAGVPDNPNDIYEWSLASGLREYLSGSTDENGMIDGNIPASEMMTRFRSFIPELVTRYDSDRTVGALTRLWREHNPEADLAPLSVELPDGYTFKVFSKDDPAGMTIGYDTDCCMTLGGASESCIYAGYSDPRFGFVGLYDQDEKLVAQSFVWHNDDTLVLDNIEGQRGRNLGDIQGRYKEALKEYLINLNYDKPELGIRNVNLGTGYLDSRISTGLERVRAVSLPETNESIYTDAGSQMRLLSLSEEELVQRGNNGPENDIEVFPTAIETQPERVAQPEMVSISSPSEGAQIINDIESQVYPAEIANGRADIREDLERPDNYSFLIGSRNGNGGTVGYMIAYHDDEADGVYVSDLALLPTEQRGGYGAAAMDYLLAMTAGVGEKRVVFEARESTSYQALQSPRVALILAKHGYLITRSQRMENYFDNGENAYEVTLEMQPVMVDAKATA